MKLIKYLVIGTIVLFFSACGSNSEQLYNKSASFWYGKILESLDYYDIDKAGDYLSSLEAEHKKSKLIPSAILMVAISYMNDEEYIMANYYFDDYIKRFRFGKNVEYIKFLKIKSMFLAFKEQFREQKLIDDAINETNKFILSYPNSQFIYLIKTIKTRLLMAKTYFDIEIANLYKRIDKPKAQRVYKNRAKKSWDNLDTIKKVDTPWYRWIFE